MIFDSLTISVNGLRQHALLSGFARFVAPVHAIFRSRETSIQIHLSPGTKTFRHQQYVV